MPGNEIAAGFVETLGALEYLLSVCVPMEAALMSSAALKRYTVEEFYELEARSLHKHQFFNGEIFLLHPPDEQGMAGAPANDNLISGVRLQV